jgi:hypothetical protein
MIAAIRLADRRRSLRLEVRADYPEQPGNKENELASASSFRFLYLGDGTV